MTQLPLPFPKPRVALMDLRPRFLGMFSHYNVQTLDAKTYDAIPTVGMLDHLVPCECKYAEATPHPKFHTAAVYLKIAGHILSVSWPTWFKL